MKKLIYSQEDLDLILSLETETKDEEIERLNNIIKGLDNTIENLTEVVDKKENLIKEAIDYIEYYLAKGKTKNHRKFDISVLDILKGENEEL